MEDKDVFFSDDPLDFHFRWKCFFPHVTSLYVWFVWSIYGIKIFNRLDLSSKFNQIWIVDEDINKNTFCAKYDHFEYPMMQFDFTNALATFIDLMNNF